MSNAEQVQTGNVERLPVKREPLVAGAPVRAIVPSSMEEAFRIATAVVEAGMAPPGLKGPAQCLIAIMQGAEVGMTPLQSIQRIAVINGRPTIWGDAAIGLVRASGRCEHVKERIDGEGDSMVAICEAKRKGEKDAIVGSFSVADAKKAGLWNKAGTWQQYPKRMLQMRARGFVLRDGFADVLGGMYLREEMEGVEPEREMRDVTPITAPPAPPTTQEIIPPKPELPKSKPKRERGEPRTSKTAYKDAQGPLDHDPETGEVREIDPDRYLDDLELRAATCASLSDLAELQEEHKSVEEQLFPPDRDKADAIFEKHSERIGGQNA